MKASKSRIRNKFHDPFFMRIGRYPLVLVFALPPLFPAWLLCGCHDRERIDLEASVSPAPCDAQPAAPCEDEENVFDLREEETFSPDVTPDSAEEDDFQAILDEPIEDNPFGCSGTYQVEDGGASIAAVLTRCLDSGDKKGALEAIRSLTYCRNLCPEARAALTAAASCSFPVSTSALSALGIEGAAAAPFFVGMLNSPKPEVRCEAAMNLGKISPLPDQAVKALVCALSDERSYVRSAVIRVLRGKEFECQVELVKALESPNDRLRTGALEALSEGSDEIAGATFISAGILKSAPSPDTRRLAARVLGRCTDRTGESVAVLLDAIRCDPSVEVKKAAVNALCNSSHKNAEVAAALIEVMDSDSEAADEAAYAIGKIGVNPEISVPALVRRLELCIRCDRSCDNVVLSLTMFGKHSAPALPALMELFRSHLGKKTGIIMAFGRIGPAANAAVPYLVDYAMLHQDEPAFESIAMIGTLGAHSALIDLARSDDTSVSLPAILAIAHARIRTPEIITCMEHLSSSKNIGISAAASRALKTLQSR